MRVYKYTNKNYCKPWSFRLGTLYDYRREEEYGSEVGDRSEGSYKLKFSDTFDTTDDFHRKVVSKQPFSTAYAKANNDDGSSTYFLTSSNLLVFSALESRDDRLYECFKHTNCCIAISDFEAFSRKIVSFLGSVVDKWEISKCYYLNKSTWESYAPAPPLPFIKENRYNYQKEVRLCISLKTPEVKPQIVKTTGLWKLCKIIGHSVK